MFNLRIWQEIILNTFSPKLKSQIVSLKWLLTTTDQNSNQKNAVKKFKYHTSYQPAR